MTLQEAKKEIFDRDKESHMDDNRIFYPDPCNENDCAICGKPKQLHKEVDGRPFFCYRPIIRKSYEELMDEVAELYADSKVNELNKSLVIRWHG